MRYALIAGNGRFPFLVLEAARASGRPMMVAAIREEADPALERLADGFHWIGIGELSKLIDLLKKNGVTQAVMAGQVKHTQIFSAIRPDWRLVKLLASLPRRNTDSLIGAVARVLADEGIELVDSTAFLKPLLAPAGPLTRRPPNAGEQGNIEYGLRVARELARLDIGQSVVIAERACVAVEAMEGTDAIIQRAATLSNGRPLTVVKVAKPNQDMRFDVPVIGPSTVRIMQQANATAISIEAGKTLLLDRDDLLRLADEAGIAITGTEGAS
jgi:UDP-2,3-diacylglucosamine hydrolase